MVSRLKICTKIALSIIIMSFKIIKHALGSFTHEDGYEKELENKIAAVRAFIVGSNLICVWVIIANVFIGWIK